MKLAIKIYVISSLIVSSIFVAEFLIRKFSSGERIRFYSHDILSDSSLYLNKINEKKEYFIYPGLKISYNSDFFSKKISNSSYLNFILINRAKYTDISIIRMDGFFKNKYDDEKFHEELDENLRNGYNKNKIFKIPHVINGCVAYRFKSRNTWLGYSVLIVDGDYLKENDRIEKCVLAAIDYFSGFPILGGIRYEASDIYDILDIDLDSLLAPEVRKAIIDAIYLCSVRGETDMVVPESTNYKLTARPTHACVKKAISEFRPSKNAS